MKIVFKKDGKKEVFNSDKIVKSIERAVKDAKLAPARFLKEVAKPTIEYFKKKEIVKTADIRKFILEKFAKTSKSAVKTWKMHEKEKNN